METGAITQYVDVAQIVLYIFWAFFAGLIYYLLRENHREGYPMDSGRENGPHIEGWPPVPEAKAYKMANGHDMLSPDLGEFDHVVAMDSLIHYDTHDIAAALSRLALRTRGSMLFTFAPHTPLLAAMHSVGRWFPKSDRSPALEPVKQAELQLALQDQPALQGWQAQRSARISRGFYTSHAWEWQRT